ncbi:MAG: Unknown protein [uncultured Thiotrichaceae bacterium]|uniref:TauD/TfdA-like domain-containing protein n=1 Tax=uncultured Thiotrichaceae bacterium TaxID=298394 RepID=A0A6S6SGC5_9GAMM|nr:MAG: Unknown protein [uncultured Thiotrichaceae bacterium]
MKNDQLRTIYPFGDGHPRIDMESYRLDCEKFTQPEALTEAVHQQWQDKGLVVLANTGMTHLSELQKYGEMIFADFTRYEGGSAPRNMWSDKVFGIDDTPCHIDMCYHNEACYLPSFPQCFVIGSLSSLSRGGETLASNNEATTDALMETDLGQTLKEKGIRYVRNMTDKYATDVMVYKHWQDTFYTDSKAEAENYVKAQGWDHEWLADGTLRTSYVVDAFEYHDRLGKDLYFAGLVSHAAFFDQWPGFNNLPDAERPFTMELGDGTPLSDDDIATVYAAYNQASVALEWQRADVAIIDNLRWSHARPAYQLQDGETRVMGVTMGMMKNRSGSRS